MIIGPEHLSTVSFTCAAVAGTLAWLAGSRHGTFGPALQRFPRSRFWGFALAAAALLWSAGMINQMTLGDLGRFKWTLVFLTPLTFFLVIQYLDELLAPRALGGLMMLAPVVMVNAARWHPSPWRYTVAILAYMLVIYGIWLMLCPFKFRIWTSAIMDSDGKRRTATGALAVMGALLLITGIVTR